MNMQFFNNEENSYDNNSTDNNPDEIERLKIKFNFSFLNPHPRTVPALKSTNN